MTAQLHDSAMYKGCTYSIVGTSSYGLFDPEKHGLKPEGECSICWRGFICGYGVEGSRLLLVELGIWLGEADAVAARQGKKPLFGIQPLAPKMPVPVPEENYFRYEKMSQPVEYTGGLLLGDGFIRELHVHMGFQPAWKYQEVHELVFDNGALVSEADRSAEMAKLRDSLGDTANGPASRRSQDVLAWIKKCFHQDYNW